MKFNIVKSTMQRNLRDAMRQAGYHSFRDSRSHQISFIKRLSLSQHYPRFHIYINEVQDQYKFNLHLDQKKASYRGQKAHSGEYDEPQIKEEAQRIQSILL